MAGMAIAVATTLAVARPHEPLTWAMILGGIAIGGGIGALINRDRFGLRLDANYTYLFQGGPDLEFFSARAGFIFYLQGASTETEAETD